MAGGIDWFRWHHGTVTDQKFPLIARRSGASVAEVIAVWACLLERASMSETERGALGGEPDFEAMDCALGVPDGRCAAVFAAMQQRDLINDELQITAWPKRQPKRERTDDNSTERCRAFRERQRHATPEEATATPEEATATPCNATTRTETPRGEERREEVIPPKPPKGDVDPAGFAEFWEAWPQSPRKVGRKSAAAKWKRHGFAAKLPVILAHVEAMRRTKQWQDGFEPAPLTYLNQERWGDGVPAEDDADELRALFARAE